MPRPSQRRVQLRWGFLILGWILLLQGPFLVHNVLSLDVWAAGLFPGDLHHQKTAMQSVMIAVFLGAWMCLLTSRGLRRNHRWSRWTGVCACVLLLPGFPWLTAVGMGGLYFLLFDLHLSPTVAKQTTDYWTRKQRGSWLQQVLGAILFAAAMVWMGALAKYAARLGMPAWNPGGRGLLYFFVFGFFITAIHEMGHATVAWALYHRVRAIRIGPFSFSNSGQGYQFHFQWKQLFNSGGHVVSIPPDGPYLRLKFITMIAAGPAASLLNGLLMLTVFLSLPGSRWQSLWWIPAFACVLAFCDGVFNLIPVGYSDGSMLFHLIPWTRHGKVLLTHIQVAQMQEDADACHKQADFDKEVELREAALIHAQESGAAGAVAIAVSHQALGRARSAQGDWPAAEVEYRKFLEFEAECALHPGLAANTWSGLQRVSRERHHADEAFRAYARALPILESRKKGRDKLGLAVSSAMLAQAHYRAGAFDLASPQIAEAIGILPGGRDRHLVRTSLYAIQAECEFSTDCVERGLAAARHAHDIVRSGKLRSEEQNLGWNELADTSRELLRLGEDSLAIGLLRDAIEQLEAGGARATAARYRIELSAALRQLGNVEEAWQCLPKDVGVSVAARRCWLTERAQLHLACGRSADAVADARSLLALWQTAAHDPVTELAVAEALLAEAFLVAGEYAQAEALARKAIEVLGPWKHRETAAGLVTLALAQWQLAGEWRPAALDEARMLVEADRLLSPAAKRRILETQAARVERYGPTREVREAVAVAAYR